MNIEIKVAHRMSSWKPLPNDIQPNINFSKRFIC